MIDSGLVEWEHGEFEGLTPRQIHEKVPDWLIFRDGCPSGETPEKVAARADRVITRARTAEGDVALFADGHYCACSWHAGSSCPPRGGQHFLLDTGTLNVLPYYRGIPAVNGLERAPFG